MIVKTFTVNPFQENTYLLYDETKEAVLIDAGFYEDHEKIYLKKFINQEGLRLKHLLNTHLHIDHQFGNKFIFDTYGLRPEANVEDEFLLDHIQDQIKLFGLPDDETTIAVGNYINEGQEITFGKTTLKTIHVPGHSPGSIAFYVEKEGALFAGDVLFRGSIGRTDLEKGDYATLILSITKKLLPLPDSTIVYSGHGPTTTIGEEKQFNPFL